MMKERGILFVMVCALCMMTISVYAQDEFTPVSPQDAGVTPLTDTVILNADVAGSSLESIGVDISSTGKIIIGWEDDASSSSPAGIAGGIRVYDSNLTNIPFPKDAEGNNVGSYYNDNGDPIIDGAGWGPKVKANWFGPGFGMGTTAFGFADPSALIPSLENVQIGSNNGEGDIPAVQLYNEDSTPILPVRSGATDAFADPDGDIRIGDWCYLANGNIAIVGESRQDAANANPPLSNPVAARTLSLAILGPNDQFPKSITRLHDGSGQHEMWHGLSPLSNGFVARFKAPSGVALRYFDNNGTPLTGDLFLDEYGVDFKLGVLNAGGRGDGEGMDTNGNNRVVVATKTNVDGYAGNEVYAAVFDANGTIICGPVLASGDDNDTGGTTGGGYNFANADRIDAAIAADGSFVVVWTDSDILGSSAQILTARIFNPDGTPATTTFMVDSRFDIPGQFQNGTNQRPRVAWRGNKIVVISESNIDSGDRLLVGRVFQYGEEASGVEEFMLY